MFLRVSGERNTFLDVMKVEIISFLLKNINHQ